MDQSEVLTVPSTFGKAPYAKPSLRKMLPPSDPDQFIELSDSELDSAEDCLTEAQLNAILASKLSATLLQQNAGRIKCTLIHRSLPNDLLANQQTQTLEAPVPDPRTGSLF